MFLFLYQTLMSVKDHARVIRCNIPMLVHSLSLNTEAFNSILDTLHASGIMLMATYAELLTRNSASPHERSDQVRRFFRWLINSHNTEPFMMFYGALNEYGLQSELEILQSIPIFWYEDKSEVSTCTGISTHTIEVPKYVKPDSSV